MRNLGAFLTAIVLAFCVHGASNAADLSCDRVCMSGLLNAYVDALVARKPSAVPIAQKYRATENAKPIKFGEGIWKTVGGPFVYRSDAVDAVNGQAGSILVLPENGRSVLVFVRVKGQGRQITEAETVIVRPSEGQRSDPDRQASALPVYEKPVSPADRLSRKQLYQAADGYLDSLFTSGTPGFVAPPLADDTDRVENGFSNAGPGRAPIVEQLRRGFGPPGGRASLKVTDRRYFADEERGVAVVIGRMNLDLPPNAPDMPGLHAVSKLNRKQILIEFFKCSGGQVRQIQAVMYDLDDPAFQTTGWPS